MNNIGNIDKASISIVDLERKAHELIKLLEEDFQKELESVIYDIYLLIDKKQFDKVGELVNLNMKVHMDDKTFLVSEMLEIIKQAKFMEIIDRTIKTIKVKFDISTNQGEIVYDNIVEVVDFEWNQKKIVSQEKLLFTVDQDKIVLLELFL